MVRWLGLYASTAGDTSSVSGWGMKIPQAMQHGQKKKKTKKTPPLFLYFSRFCIPDLFKMKGRGNYNNYMLLRIKTSTNNTKNKLFV